jgi:hypothetical protein
MTEKLFQNDLFKKTSASNMIYTYHYLSTMAGEPTPFFSIKPLVFFQFYTGPKPSQNVQEIQTGIYVLDIVYT